MLTVNTPTSANTVGRRLPQSEAFSGAAQFTPTVHAANATDGLKGKGTGTPDPHPHSRPGVEGGI